MTCSTTTDPRQTNQTSTSGSTASSPSASPFSPSSPAPPSPASSPATATSTRPGRPGSPPSSTSLKPWANPPRPGPNRHAPNSPDRGSTGPPTSSPSSGLPLPACSAGDWSDRAAAIPSRAANGSACRPKPVSPAEPTCPHSSCGGRARTVPHRRPGSDDPRHRGGLQPPAAGAPSLDRPWVGAGQRAVTVGQDPQHDRRHPPLPWARRAGIGEERPARRHAGASPQPRRRQGVRPHRHHRAGKRPLDPAARRPRRRRRPSSCPSPYRSGAQGRPG